MEKKRDVDLRQVMAEEGSRGRRHPVRAATLETRRRISRAAAFIANKGYEKRDYLKLLREDFGLRDESPEFQEYEKLWNDYRGKF
ncbi:MAG TPA: hypothetical protein VKO18_00685 [Terriglobia bacterium]|nr:hypothetical protein [Terriglobia bacterium]